MVCYSCSGCPVPVAEGKGRNGMRDGHFFIACITILGGGFMAHLHPDTQAVVFPVVSSVVFHYLGVKQGEKKNGNGV